MLIRDFPTQCGPLRQDLATNRWQACGIWKWTTKLSSTWHRRRRFDCICWRNNSTQRSIRTSVRRSAVRRALIRLSATTPNETRTISRRSLKSPTPTALSPCVRICSRTVTSLAAFTSFVSRQSLTGIRLLAIRVPYWHRHYLRCILLLPCFCLFLWMKMYNHRLNQQTLRFYLFPSIARCFRSERRN